MKRPWAFICASEGATSKHLRNYCREVYLLGYLPVCPKLQDSQYLVLEDAMERSEYTAIVRDKLLRCPMLVVCSPQSGCDHQRADRLGAEIQPYCHNLGRFEESRFGGRRPCVMNRFAGCRVLQA